MANGQWLKAKRIMYTFDHDLFLWLNFDGGPVMDSFMTAVSGVVMWIPLYAFILYFAYRNFGWQRMLGFVLCLILALGFSDILCGIFKHSGPLKDLWPSLPGRERPMFESAVREFAHVVSYGHGKYGTISAHAATIVSLAWLSALMIRKNWYKWLIAVVVLLVCYSRIYLACHFPMDILLGALVGTIVGVSIFFLWKKFDKVIEKSIK